MARILDDIDRKIIALLQEDGRKTNLEIAGKIGKSEGTVRKRLQRLLQERIIEITAVTNPFRMGALVDALIGLRVDLDKLEEIGEQLVAMEEVRYCGYCAGTYDILVEALFSSNDELYHFLSKRLASIAGIRQTETFPVLKVPKYGYKWLMPSKSDAKPSVNNDAEEGKGNRRAKVASKARG
jgi:Lrp/AsnC family transcriptional regulator for asnA, asnC and gidA